jgi:cytochrome c
MNMRNFAMTVLAMSATGWMSLPAMAGDVAAGEKVFKKCATCHFPDKETNKVGPHLVGLFGRTAGKLEGYKYSPAMAASTVVWSAETLVEYLKKPKDFVAGTKMTFAGITDETQLADLVAFLEEKTKKPE